jgi:putative ABC transport system permease protein
MFWIAIKMLTGCRGKFYGLIIGVAFASLLIAQQSSIFCGVMRSSTSQIRDVHDAEIWVMDPSVRYMAPVKPLRDGDLQRVRSVPGVAWAVPYFSGSAHAEAAKTMVREVFLVGLDDQSLAGGPRRMVIGSVEDLRRPGAVVIDEAGYRLLWPDEPLRTGRTLTFNQRRTMEVVGICRSSRSLRSWPLLYTRRSELASIFPGRGRTSFILARPQAGRSAAEIARSIEERTGFQARTRDEFGWQTMDYIFRNTGIPANFAITVALGFLVGVLVAGQTFYLVTLENVPRFATLKAIGTTNLQLVIMILSQSMLVGVLGCGIGVGLAALFGQLIGGHSRLMFYMPWQILAVTAAGVLAMMALASLVSIRRVMVLEPAIVFRT